MGYTVADMFNLFQFSEGLTGIEVCRRTGITTPQMQFAKAEDVLAKKTNELMVRRFGENWNSVENLRKYQEKKNIITKPIFFRGKKYPSIKSAARENNVHERVVRREGDANE